MGNVTLKPAMTNSAQPASGRSRRRVERANVRRRLKGVFLKCPTLAPTDLRVYNLSELGLGVETSPIGQAPNAGTEMDARLVVGLTNAPVRVRLVHMNPQMTGLALIEPTELVQGAIRQYFENELAGAALRPVGPPPKIVLGEPYSLRFKDTKSNSIEIFYESDRIVRFSLRVLGNQIEWNRGSPTQLVQESGKAPVSDMLRYQLLRFIQSSEALGDARQASLEEALLTSST